MNECSLCHHPNPAESVVWRNDERITTLSCCGAEFVWRVPKEAIASIQASVALRREK
jgi:hypothetical protein